MGAHGTTLFCFTAPLSKIGPGAQPKLQDPKQIDLVKTQHATKTSIFGCEKWEVFSDVLFQLTPGPPHEIFSTVVDFPKPAIRPNTKLWVNTLLYVNIWNKIRQAGHHANYDWTVKVDVTTIFLPIRLRRILKDQKQTDSGVYLEHAHFSYAGEDKFLQRCMDLHGIDKIPSTFELGMGKGLHTTITCPAHLPKLTPKEKK